MQTIQSRLYLNVILTVIAILLAIVAFQPYVTLSTTAQAQRTRDFRPDSEFDVKRNEQQDAKSAGLLEGQYRMFADATRDVAKANHDIAEAIREAAKSQKEIAQAIGKLSQQ